MPDKHTDLSIALFGAETLWAQLEALTQEMPGVRLAEDSECVHRMRVATRRLRTRLALFAPCLPEKRIAGWRKRIRRLTIVLGAARDTDVQQAYVQRFYEQSIPPREKPGIARLLLRLQQRRQELQRNIMETLDAFEDSHTLEELSRTLQQLRTKSNRQHKDAHSPALFALAAEAISTHLATMHGYEPYVHQPEQSAALHALRIATKHLRYVLETFAPLYPDELASYLHAAREQQRLLGEIHDCDVWMQKLTGFLDEERRRALDYQGHTRDIHRLHAGIASLAADRHAHREENYRQFVACWTENNLRGLWQALLKKING